jgi:Transposase DDE domain group 1
VVRADSGFFDDELLSFLEERRLPYIVVARMTQWVQRAAQRVEQWRELDENYALGEFHLRLWSWQTERRFIVLRERMRESRLSVGRKLIDVPGYTFRIFVTSQTQPAEEVWRDYNRRGDVENRIGELKHDLGADGFCMHKFFATEAAFRAVLLVFNLLAEFQRAAGLSRAGHPTHTNSDLRSHFGPCRPTPRASSIPKLGRPERTQPLDRQHLKLVNPNFAEVQT